MPNNLRPSSRCVLIWSFWFIEFYFIWFHFFSLYFICASTPNDACPTVFVNTSMAVGVYWHDQFDSVISIWFHFIFFVRACPTVRAPPSLSTPPWQWVRTDSIILIYWILLYSNLSFVSCILFVRVCTAIRAPPSRSTSSSSGCVLTWCFWFIFFYFISLHFVCASMPCNSWPALSVSTSMAVGTYWLDSFDLLNSVWIHFMFLYCVLFVRACPTICEHPLCQHLYGCVLTWLFWLS